VRTPRRPRSLRGRLVLGAVLIGLVFGTVFGLAAVSWVTRAQDQSVLAALQTRLQLAQKSVGPDGALPADPAGPKADLVQVLSPNGDVLSSSAALRGFGPLIDPSTVTGPASVRGSIGLTSPDVDLATLALPWQVDQSGASTPAVLVVAVDTEGFTTARDNLTGLLVAGLAAVVLVLAGLAWWVSGRTLRNVTRLTERAERIDASELRDGLPVPPDDTELAHLVVALNRMLLRLHAAHTTELTFAAEAGHRLRTPLATLRAEAELALAEGDGADQSTALQQIVADADQLSLVVDQMLARRRARVEASLPLGSLLEAAAAGWQRQARVARVDLRIDARVWGPERFCPGFREVLDPVVDNAVRHCPADGLVLVAATLDTSTASPSLVVEISDDGGGVSEDIAPRIFEPWVSSREAGQAGGLGLWASRQTARDLGGDVVVSSRTEGRTLFVARLPLQEATDEA
jgi:signal transduction histidine kinase